MKNKEIINDFYLYPGLFSCYSFFKCLLLAILFSVIFTNNVSSQTYINGNLSTGSINSAGVTAPSGSTWSEVQRGNSIIVLPATNGSNLLADDFFVCGNWKVTKFTFY